MNFLETLDGAEVLSQSGNPLVTGIDYDSRRVQPGFVFVAMKGEATDGNRYIDQAIAGGAVAVVSDSASEKSRPGVAWAQVPHGRRALARLSANFYKRPAEKLRITGITGTNGKTTTTFILEGMLRAAGRKNVLIGTVEYHVGDEVLPAPHTTPESLELNQMFARAVGNGATEAVMEVSSHALEQQRVFGVPFDVAVFSNLTRDHLDYHGTFEEYFASKRILFQGCGTEAPRVSVLNADDAYGVQLADFSRKQGSQVLTYGVEQGDFHTQKLDISPAGNRFELVTPAGTWSIWSPLIGRVNVYNVLAASAAAFARGCTEQQIVIGIAHMERVPGRFERVNEGQPFAVVVDYAHTDDALKNLTALAREFVNRGGGRGRVITVFGCGGDRDRSKRPLMGEAAARGSDFVVVTSDNPRSEDPLAIINDSVPGLQRVGARYALEPDRHKAIALALSEANADDIVLIAGKGHERTQTTREGVFPFDDFEVASEEVKKLGYKKAESAGKGMR
ncbi:MAG TPA: UDP-N-acetylmuramoyl-L-alanyl-D-glutamate--2,6-diaminopimelate ligase [Clostridia bacterium]|nr:UDP-N-acetylmuramoyl-L-alanyl-D-glutamate--2,6-diaminopimelate ligase [Clostridia bacterium]